MKNRGGRAGSSEARLHLQGVQGANNRRRRLEEEVPTFVEGWWFRASRPTRGPRGSFTSVNHSILTLFEDSAISVAFYR